MRNGPIKKFRVPRDLAYLQVAKSSISLYRSYSGLGSEERKVQKVCQLNFLIHTLKWMCLVGDEVVVT